MACTSACWLLLASLVLATVDAGAGKVGAAQSRSLLQTWGKALDGTGSGATDTPVTRVVNLLKDMQKTLQKEMDEDEALYDKLSCWCNNNEYEKDGSISDSEAKIAELEASIEGLTAKSSGLQTSIKELEGEAAADKSALAEATALREKQQKEFHGGEVDSIQAVENLKAAIEVLSKHEGAPESTVAGGAIFKSEKDSWSSLLSVKSSRSRSVLSPDHDVSRMAHTLDDFMRRNGFDDGSEGYADVATPRKFLAQDGSDSTAITSQPTASWSSEESSIVKRALKSASAFVQSRHGGSYYPAYNSRSGEIMGVLRQLKEEMEADLSEAQKREQARGAAFDELRSAKSAEISNGERMAEQKEDEYANTKNNLAESKEDLDQEQASLSADQKFRINLKQTCAEASKNFQARKSARLEETKAVSETIGILMQDNARDAMTGTYSFVQVKKGGRENEMRQKAAQVLRQKAKALKQPQLSILATTVELDAFSKVKKAIDDMVAMLKVQQKDEVKKNDYCKAELQENEMTTSKTEDHKADLTAKSSELASTIQTLEENIANGKKQIAQLQLELQRASEDRKNENMDFQKTVADQSATISVLKTALDRLATYYDKEAFMQRTSQEHSSKQTPPVPQMEYKPSKGATGVMELVEKLIVDAKKLSADSVKAESEAQAAYEQTIADTNGSVAALMQEVTSKTKAKAEANKDKLQTDSDIADTVTELEGLSKYNSELHGECDYLLKNFGTRQEARAQEIEALQQAKQILSGASLN